MFVGTMFHFLSLLTGSTKMYFKEHSGLCTFFRTDTVIKEIKFISLSKDEKACFTVTELKGYGSGHNTQECYLCAHHNTVF